jgi:hypothetical protein
MPKIKNLGSAPSFIPASNPFPNMMGVVRIRLYKTVVIAWIFLH